MNESFIAGGSAMEKEMPDNASHCILNLKKAYRRLGVTVNYTCTVSTFAIRDTALLSLDELLDEGKNIVWLIRLDLRYTSISSFRVCATSQKPGEHDEIGGSMVEENRKCQGEVRKAPKRMIK